jgi:hypothetical protein
MRPDWDSYFMKIAYAVSERSTCDRAFVGCVLVLDKRILTTGFNGSPAGQDHCDEAGHLMVDGHCVRTIHARDERHHPGGIAWRFDPRLDLLRDPPPLHQLHQGAHQRRHLPHRLQRLLPERRKRHELPEGGKDRSHTEGVRPRISRAAVQTQIIKSRAFPARLFVFGSNDSTRPE